MTSAKDRLHSIDGRTVAKRDIIDLHKRLAAIKLNTIPFSGVFVLKAEISSSNRFDAS